jgi:ribosomal protein S18 acetylase RimI-like enzyme
MIRDAVPRDYPFIAELNVAAYEEFRAALPPANWHVMQRNLTNIEERSRNSQFLVFEHRQELVGSVAYCPPGKGDPQVFQSTWASILLVAVKPGYRRQGIAAALVSECIARAGQDAASHVGLFTSELMQGAQALYCRLGFEKLGQLPPRNGLNYYTFLLPLMPNMAPVSK